MAKIAVVGVGTIGVAFAKIVLAVTKHDVVLVDKDEDALLRGLAEIVGTMTDLVAERIEVESLEAALVRVKLVACCAPYKHVAAIANAAHERGLHYLDFTEDNSVTKAISQLKVESSTFVPQTGLAPGLINYIGLAIAKDMDIKRLALRVGALPQVTLGPSRYSITWSPDGLINEYLQPVLRKVNGQVVEVKPLEDLEDVMINGVAYEAFTTSGGVGDLGAYPDIPTVEYKTLRYPGHLAFMKELLTSVNYDQGKAVDLAARTFARTRHDVVALAVEALDHDGVSHTIGAHFQGNLDFNLTAIELTTAGTGVAVAELILDGKLPLGVLKPSQVPFEALCKTGAGQLVGIAGYTTHMLINKRT